MSVSSINRILHSCYCRQPRAALVLNSLRVWRQVGAGDPFDGLPMSCLPEIIRNLIEIEYTYRTDFAGPRQPCSMS